MNRAPSLTDNELKSRILHCLRLRGRAEAKNSEVRAALSVRFDIDNVRARRVGRLLEELVSEGLVLCRTSDCPFWDIKIGHYVAAPVPA